MPTAHQPPSPWDPAPIAISVSTAPAGPTTPSSAAGFAPEPRVLPRRVRAVASDMSAAERADFDRVFQQKLKPAVQKWCAIYAGHVPFRAEDVTPDKLRERIFPGSPSEGYAFVIDGATLCVQDNRGSVYVEYLMAPAAQELFRLSKAASPLAKTSVDCDEIHRLLKLDSGKEFPPNQVAIRPTKHATAMSGGVFVDVGEDVHNPHGGSLPRLSMVFDSDGRLACYLRSRPPK